MTVYHRFPYTNFHELNLDWLLQMVKHLEEWCAQFDPDLIKNDIQNIINQMVEDGSFDEFFAEWITPLQDDISSLEARVTILEATVTEHGTKITTLESHVDTLDDTVYNINDNINVIQQDIDDIIDRLDVDEQNITTLTNNYTTLSATVSTLSSDYGDFKTGTLADLTAILTRLTSAENSITTLTNDLSDLDTDYTAFKAVVTPELADHEARITALENQTPVTPDYHVRNMTYRGQEFDSINALLTAVESGVAYTGDFAVGNIKAVTNVNTSVRIYVAKHFKNDGAFLIVLPFSFVSSRGQIRYETLGTPESIGPYVDRWARYIASQTFGDKLATFNITSSNNSSVYTVSGALLSATQYFGYPAFEPSSALGCNVNGKFNFVDEYLRLSGDIMLMDNDANNFAYFQANESGSIGGTIKYESDATLERYLIPFVVKYNG